MHTHFNLYAIYFFSYFILININYFTEIYIFLLELILYLNLKVLFSEL